ncbi:nucleoside 2-deoxyribosyltransferase [Terasakiella pusilla]|uniref:nucleoside 2-deoxyribosyltransferase n=1 Tax=Terasakiella pusilla TaxID=64973 RepID=UPI003AA9AB5A
MNNETVLVVGEIIIDFTLMKSEEEPKMRMGGIVHAARGLWASNINYSVAAVCPKYLLDQAKKYLLAHGCIDFIWLGEVIGAPNVIVIGDPTEVSHQGYEDILREEKEVIINENLDELKAYTNIIVFPGKYSLPAISSYFSDNAVFCFDIAYGISDLSELACYKGNIHSLILSTSSEFFLESGTEEFEPLLSNLKKYASTAILLKENRGGSRLFNLPMNDIEEIPAILNKTVNSVGVGDVYSAVYTASLSQGVSQAAWRGFQAATCYSQTTFPNDLKRDINREHKLPIGTVKELGGTILPWHERSEYPIYLAAPDFSYIHKPEIDYSVEALEYHNFLVRRPILENGELPKDSNDAALRQTYEKDYALIKECAVMFAVPLQRDPGTLVEIGLAIEMGIPVITFDPRNENDNTMVMAGSDTYSRDLDTCLNGLFNCLSKMRK